MIKIIVIPTFFTEVSASPDSFSHNNGRPTVLALTVPGPAVPARQGQPSQCQPRQRECYGFFWNTSIIQELGRSKDAVTPLQFCLYFDIVSVIVSKGRQDKDKHGLYEPMQQDLV